MQKFEMSMQYYNKNYTNYPASGVPKSKMTNISLIFHHRQIIQSHMLFNYSEEIKNQS